jgi:hypothetical protein
MFVIVGAVWGFYEEAEEEKRIFEWTVLKYTASEHEMVYWNVLKVVE